MLASAGEPFRLPDPDYRHPDFKWLRSIREEQEKGNLIFSPITFQAVKHTWAIVTCLL